MVTGCRKASAYQGIVHFLHRLSGQTVDDPAFATVLRQICQRGRKLIFWLLYGKEQVFPVKTGDQGDRILQPQDRCNILSYFCCCCRRKSTDYRPYRQLLHKIRDLQIARTKILSPLRNTMSLIDTDHGNFYLRSRPEKAVCQKTLRCHIDDLVTSLDQIPQSSLILPGRKRTV